MRLACHLRAIRGERKLREIADPAGVPVSLLSMIERGQMVPRDEWITGLEQSYGAPIADWYEWRPPNGVALAEGDA